MKIVVAMDSFKGSLTAPEASRLVRDGLLSEKPDWDIVLKPMADGGEGTARAMIAARGGEWIPATVTGPLPDMQVEAGFAWFDQEQEALVEMASASGIEWLTPDQLNPLQTTTLGTGELIKLALKRNPKRILLTVGGSATVDGGLGAAQALGWRFFDAAGQKLGPGGEGCGRVVRMEAPGLTLPPVDVLCDVQNPLLGPNGAAPVFGPQKGATPAMVEQLSAGLSTLRDRVFETLGVEMNVPGGGAAGGLSAGAVAFMNGRLVPGTETVIAAMNLEASLRDADWVVTGEGRFDAQSLGGKVVSGISRLAAKTDTKVAVIAGGIQLDEATWKSEGVARALATKPDGMSLDEALRNAGPLLKVRAAQLAATL